MSELTLGQALAHIEAQCKEVTLQLAVIPTSEWRTQRDFDLCNRENELRAALVVLRELAGENAPKAAIAAAPL
ncbi:hypothetical protein D3C81_2217990 [compost metagenome]